MRTIPEPPEALTSASVIWFVRASYVAVMSASPAVDVFTGRLTTGLATSPDCQRAWYAGA